MADKKSNSRLWEKVGGWSFLAGVVIAVILGVMGERTPTTTNILLVLGLIVGLLNITGKEIVPFLVASVALIVSGLVGGVSQALPGWLTAILANIIIFVVPAAIVASLKTIYVLAATK